jgi:hypothetical protein
MVTPPTSKKHAGTPGISRPVRRSRRRYPAYLEAHKSPSYDTEPIFAELLDEVLATPGKALKSPPQSSTD